MHAIFTSCEAKARTLADERETGRRSLLNLGYIRARL